MSEIFDAMFDVGYPMLLAFGLGVMFGVRVIRHVLTKRILQEENILDGGRSKDGSHTASLSRPS